VERFFTGHKTSKAKITYCIVIQQITKKLQKKWQKTVVGIGKKSTFAPQFTAEERWVSG
jgi:hypothetical protein